MKTLKFVLLVGIAVTLASCCSCRKGYGPNRPITDIKWTVVQIGSQAVNAKDNFHLTLSSADKRAFGRGDCNQFTGSFTGDSFGSIKFGPMAATRAFCPNQEMEDKLFQAFDRVDNFSHVTENVLILLNGNVPEIILQAR